jgi:hypothetical protein
VRKPVIEADVASDATPTKLSCAVKLAASGGGNGGGRGGGGGGLADGVSSAHAE